jgi:hypothetical protein
MLVVGALQLQPAHAAGERQVRRTDEAAREGRRTDAWAGHAAQGIAGHRPWQAGSIRQAGRTQAKAGRQAGRQRQAGSRHSGRGAHVLHMRRRRPRRRQLLLQPLQRRGVGGQLPPQLLSLLVGSGAGEVNGALQRRGGWAGRGWMCVCVCVCVCAGSVDVRVWCVERAGPGAGKSCRQAVGWLVGAAGEGLPEGVRGSHPHLALPRHGQRVCRPARRRPQLLLFGVQGSHGLLRGRRQGTRCSNCTFMQGF